MSSPASETQGSILIVDDNPVARKLLTLLLKSEGHRLLIARDGPEALRIAEEVPDLALVLLDVMMPGMDGLEVCRRLRALAGESYVPIIFATALDDEAHVVEGLAAGANDYVTKPLKQAEVLARVRTALRLKRALDELLGARELAAIGAMAVTLGHEINNPLTILMGNLELLLRSSDWEGKALRRLQDARAAATRVQELVRRLTRIKKVTTTSYVGSVQMLDLERSCPQDGQAPPPACATDTTPNETAAPAREE